MKKVQAGQAVEIKATTWNAFIDAAEYVKNRQTDLNASGLQNNARGGMIHLRNGESTLFPQFSAMVLTDVLIKPAANEKEFTGKTPTFLGKMMTESLSESPYAILLEPIAAGKIGRALVLGVIPAKVTVLDADHKFAEPIPGNSTGTLQSTDSGVARILWKAGSSGSQWCMLQLGGAGSGGGTVSKDDRVILCQVTSGNAESGFAVSLYANGKDATSTGSGILFAPELALNATIPSGSWVLGHKNMIAATGGNES